jgi:hypothetical protein
LEPCGPGAIFLPGHHKAFSTYQRQPTRLTDQNFTRDVRMYLFTTTLVRIGQCWRYLFYGGDRPQFVLCSPIMLSNPYGRFRAAAPFSFIPNSCRPDVRITCSRLDGYLRNGLAVGNT